MLDLIGGAGEQQVKCLTIKATLLCSSFYIICLINPSLLKWIDQSSFQMNVVKSSRFLFHLFAVFDEGMKKEANLKN